MTLVELMIAMTLSLLLLLGLTQIFVGNKQGYKIQEGNSALQENGRFAIDYIARNIHLAAFFNGVKVENILGTPTTVGRSGATTCVQAWVNNIQTPFQGFDGDGLSVPPLDCIPNSDYAAGTDVVVVRYADPDGYKNDDQMDTLKNSGANDAYLRLRTGRNGLLFNLPGAVTGPNSWLYAKETLKKENATDEGILNYPYRVAVLFIRACSMSSTATCTATSDNGKPIPTLVSAELTAQGTAAPQIIQAPLVENVEQLQIEYGVDLDGNRSADRYYKASEITGTPPLDWSRVVVARVGIVVRGNAQDGLSDTETYGLPGGYSYVPAANAQKFQRRIFIKDVQIRNRVRS